MRVIILTLIAMLVGCTDPGTEIPSELAAPETAATPPEPDAYYEYLWCKEGSKFSEDNFRALVADWNEINDGLSQGPTAAFAYDPSGWEDPDFDGLWVLRWEDEQAMEAGWEEYIENDAQTKLDAAHPGVLECGAEKGVNRFGFNTYIPKETPETFDPNNSPYYLNNQFCSFNEGKSPEDLRDAVMNHFLPAVLAASEANPASSYWFKVEAPQFTPPEDNSFDFNWVNFWQTAEEGQASSDAFAASEQGSAVQSLMNEVATCQPAIAQAWNGYMLRVPKN